MRFGIHYILRYSKQMESARGRLARKQSPWMYCSFFFLVIIIGTVLAITSWLFEIWLAIHILRFLNFI